MAIAHRNERRSGSNEEYGTEGLDSEADASDDGECSIAIKAHWGVALEKLFRRFNGNASVLQTA